MINLGVIGAGNICKEHLKCFDAIQNVRIAGITSRTTQRAESIASEFKIPKVTSSIQELVDKVEIDLLLVVVSVESAYSVLEEAIKLKIPILTEKPLALNYSLSYQLLELAKKYECKVWVALNRRAYDSTRKVLKEIESINTRRIIQINDQQDLDAVRKIGHSDEVQHYWMYANSIHLVDYLYTFGRGEIEEIIITNKFDRSEPSFVSASVSFSSGDVGIYTGLWNMPGPWSCTITTKSKRWELQPLEQFKTQVRGSRDWIECERDISDTRYKAGLYHQSNDIVDSILNNTPSKIPTIEEAVKTMKLVSDIYETD